MFFKYILRVLRFSFVVWLFLPICEVCSIGEEDIYDDPKILKVYDQSAIIENLDQSVQKKLISFKDLSGGEQKEFLEKFSEVQDKLEKEYKNKKSKLINERLIKFSIASIFCVLAPLTLISGLNRCILEGYNKIDIAVILPPLALHGFIYFFFKVLEIGSRKFVSTEGPIQDYEIQYVRFKPFLGKDLRKVFKSKLLAARKNPSAIHDHLKWFRAATKLPIAKKSISLDQFKKKFDDEFSIFPSDIQNKVKSLCIRQIIQKNSRVMAYFEGPSGVGKTSCAKAIADCLELPFGSVALANYSVSDLIGQGGIHQPHPGKIAEAILNAKNQGKTYTNMVFLIDEVDEVLSGDGKNDILPFLLTLLDPETESYYNPYFESHIRIKDMLIILAGNKSISHHKSLEKRLVPVVFKGFTKEYQKEYIIKEFIPELYKQTSDPYVLDIEKHFASDDKEKILKLVDEEEDLGLRNVQEVARKFVDEKIIEIFLKDEKIKKE